MVEGNKKAKEMRTVKQILGCHRVHQGSLSQNKIDLIRYHWIVYRVLKILVLYIASI